MSPSLASALFEPGSTELQVIVEREARVHHVCAASYATVHGGKLAVSGGVSGCQGAKVPTADSVFQAASLSKPVFAYAVLKLAREGVLGLDVPLVSYLPQGYVHVQNLFAREPGDLRDVHCDGAMGRVGKAPCAVSR